MERDLGTIHGPDPKPRGPFASPGENPGGPHERRLTLGFCCFVFCQGSVQEEASHMRNVSASFLKQLWTRLVWATSVKDHEKTSGALEKRLSVTVLGVCDIREGEFREARAVPFLFWLSRDLGRNYMLG